MLGRRRLCGRRCGEVWLVLGKIYAVPAGKACKSSASRAGHANCFGKVGGVGLVIGLLGLAEATLGIHKEGEEILPLSKIGMAASRRAWHLALVQLGVQLKEKALFV